MTQFTLKLLAMIFMLIDHTVKVLLPPGTLAAWVGMEQELLIRNIMLILGRASFPIFAWFAAEGCRKTSHLGKHCLYLLLFGILSEIPFQLCFYDAYNTGLQWGCHNVLFTMLLAAGAIYLIQIWEENGLPKAVSRILIISIALWKGWTLQTDYNIWGVGLILALYYLPEGWGRLGFLAAWVSVFQLLWHGWNGSELIWLSGTGRIQLLYWLGGLLGVALLAAYSGQRGRGSKWLFYCFYPVHLMLLFLLSRIL